MWSLLSEKPRTSREISAELNQPLFDVNTELHQKMKSREVTCDTTQVPPVWSISAVKRQDQLVDLNDTAVLVDMRNFEEYDQLSQYCSFGLTVIAFGTTFPQFRPGGVRFEYCEDEAIDMNLVWNLAQLVPDKRQVFIVSESVHLKTCASRWTEKIMFVPNWNKLRMFIE